MMNKNNNKNNNTSNNTSNKNPYGHLLDKYLDSDHLDFKTKQQREEEGKKRYGNLLDKAKPDYSTLKIMEKIENDRIERRKQEARDKKIADMRRQERIENERRKEEEHNAQVKAYGESLIIKKQEQIKAAQKVEEERQKAAEEQQKIYDRIDSLMKISPESANAYIQAMKMGGCI